MNLEEIQNSWNNDCAIDDNHLGEESTKTPKLHSKYIREMINTKLQLTKARADYNMLRKIKFRYYRGEMSKEELVSQGWQQWQGVKPLKNEMDEFISGDQDLVAMTTKIEYLEAKGYLLESILNQIKSRDWQLRNAIQWKQFLSGM